MRAHCLHGAVVAVLLLCVSVPLLAQNRSPQERREQLAKVQEQLADPDPLMRLAYMEEVVASGDALRMQIAMRTAFASDDPDLRAIALRAYLASHRDFTFDVNLPVQLQKVVDGITPGTQQEVERQYPFLRTLKDYAFKVHIIITEYRLGENSGKMGVNAGVDNFTITGDTLSISLIIRNIGTCYIEFSPTRKQMLEGKIACGGVWPKFDISTRAF